MPHNTNSLKKKRSSATIVADGKRFSHQINMAEVFGTHNGRPNAEQQILGFEPAPPLEQVGDEHSEQMQDRKHRPQSCDDFCLMTRIQPNQIFGKDMWEAAECDKVTCVG